MEYSLPLIRARVIGILVRFHYQENERKPSYLCGLLYVVSKEHPEILVNLFEKLEIDFVLAHEKRLNVALELFYEKLLNDVQRIFGFNLRAFIEINDIDFSTFVLDKEPTNLVAQLEEELNFKMENFSSLLCDFSSEISGQVATELITKTYENNWENIGEVIRQVMTQFYIARAKKSKNKVEKCSPCLDYCYGK